MSEKITAMIEEIKGLTVLELSELVHALEEEFGVSLTSSEKVWAFWAAMARLWLANSLALSNSFWRSYNRKSRFST